MALQRTEVKAEFQKSGPIGLSFNLALVHGSTPIQSNLGDKKMKNEIHPNYVETKVTCGCGEVFTTRSTKESGSIYVEVCSVCHPFYTGKQRILDTGGRVAKFEKRFGASTTN